ncbi:MAG: homoserine O-acetyltransferase [Flavobacteriales bacterium]|nr:homoserine O-acetyltransferase [Flavobacteriales bacterium]
MQILKTSLTLPLERGGEIVHPEIAYHTYGQLNEAKDNVIWIMHHLTANSDAAEWWPDLVGESKLFDPTTHFIVCANNLGSCYGSTGPASISPETGQPYLGSFPPITIRDIVAMHRILKDHLQIKSVALAVGGSMGGYQVLEWNLMEPGLIKANMVLATNARETAWAIGIHETQRMAIALDPTWKKGALNDAAQGLSLARAIGMLSYRSFEIFKQAQSDQEPVFENTRVASYLHYQGKKLVDRYNAYSYWALSYAMDSHHLGRGRGSLEEVLASIKSPTLVLGIGSDILCPVSEQEFLTKHLGSARLCIIDSMYGHDGFMVESGPITRAARDFLNELSSSL